MTRWRSNRCYLQSAIYSNVLNGNEDRSLWNVGRPCMPETSGCNILQPRSIPYILVIIFEKVWEGIEKVHLLDSSFKVTDAWSMIPPIITTYLMATCLYYQPTKRFNVIVSYMIGWFWCCNFAILLYYDCFIAVTWISFAHSETKATKSQCLHQKKNRGKVKRMGSDPSLKLTISHLKRMIAWKTNILERLLCPIFLGNFCPPKPATRLP